MKLFPDQIVTSIPPVIIRSLLCKKRCAQTKSLIGHGLEGGALFMIGFKWFFGKTLARFYIKDTPIHITKILASSKILETTC